MEEFKYLEANGYELALQVGEREIILYKLE